MSKKRFTIYADEKLIARVVLLQRRDGRASVNNTIVHLLDQHLPALQGAELRSFLKGRRAQRAESGPPSSSARCPSCHSDVHFIRFATGKWRCGMCCAQGSS